MRTKSLEILERWREQAAKAYQDEAGLALLREQQARAFGRLDRDDFLRRYVESLAKEG